MLDVSSTDTYVCLSWLQNLQNYNTVAVWTAYTVQENINYKTIAQIVTSLMMSCIVDPFVPMSCIVDPFANTFTK